MSYRDWNTEMVCPYNNFKECMYDKCPFFYIGHYSKLRCKKAEVDSFVQTTTYKNETKIQVNSRLF